MQNPKRALEKSKLYRVASEVVLHSTKSHYSKMLTKVPANGIVMFLKYSPGTVHTCMVMYGEYYGWIVVDKGYKDHTYFFREVKDK
jgi:hypothetical protein